MSIITLITGANQGIGLATAVKLARDHGHHVIIGSRNAESGAKAANSLKSEGYKADSVQLDLTSQPSIDAAVKTIRDKYGKLDVLINNAGILCDRRESLTTRELWTMTMETNVIGTACLTEALLPLLRKASAQPNVVFVSSQMGSLHQALIKGTPSYAIDYKAYDASKAAENILALNYVRILEDVGARVNIACPGLVATTLTGYMAAGATPEIGATRIVELATLGKDGPTGTFSNSSGPIAW